ncbi:hypothetical protein EYF80_057286 [Liparis tanakae]|uniref:Uncharacterized protein n=1 Tax=Liparis tanakae TaxID=230148 RepID=A0A4Z2EUU6_9TELE|nr:hypothetical protein EYF80_057286 [Liparis tanakae]
MKTKGWLRVQRVSCVAFRVFTWRLQVKPVQALLVHPASDSRASAAGVRVVGAVLCPSAASLAAAPLSPLCVGFSSFMLVFWKSWCQPMTCWKGIELHLNEFLLDNLIFCQPSVPRSVWLLSSVCSPLAGQSSSGHLDTFPSSSSSRFVLIVRGDMIGQTDLHYYEGTVPGVTSCALDSLLPLGVHRGSRFPAESTPTTRPPGLRNASGGFLTVIERDVLKSYLQAPTGAAAEGRGEGHAIRVGRAHLHPDPSAREARAQSTAGLFYFRVIIARDNLTVGRHTSSSSRGSSCSRQVPSDCIRYLHITTATRFIKFIDTQKIL